VIADVDCTVSESAPLCRRYRVSGYPTLKYFLPGKKTSRAYSGGRDYAALKAFVEETLEPRCAVDAPEGCSPALLPLVYRYAAMGEAERAKLLADLEEELRVAEHDHSAVKHEVEFQKYKAEQDMYALRSSHKRRSKLLTAAMAAA